MARIGLDIHGVIDSDPELFAEFTRFRYDFGDKITIITGQAWGGKLAEWLNEIGIVYDDFLSIHDYHKELGTFITYDERGRPWMDDDLWCRTKGELCKQHGIDLMIDDKEAYLPFIECDYVLYKGGGKTYCTDNCDICGLCSVWGVKYFGGVMLCK